MPDFETHIREIVETADKEEPKGEIDKREGEIDKREGEIDKREKREIAEMMRNAEKLHEFFREGALKETALHNAIVKVASEYINLSPEEIYGWIKEGAAQAPIPKAGIERPAEIDTDKAWDKLNNTKKLNVLLDAHEKMKITPAQERRLEQLELITMLVKGALDKSEKEAKKSWYETINKIFYPISSAKKDFGTAAKIAYYKAKVNSFLTKKVPQLERLIMQNPQTPLRDLLDQILPVPPGEKTFYETYAAEGVRFDECRNKDEMILQKVEFVKHLRKIGDYQSARFICEDALQPQLKKAFEREDFKGKDLVFRNIDVGGQIRYEKVMNDLYIESLTKIGSKMSSARKEKIIKSLQKEPHNFSESEARGKLDAYIKAIIYEDYSRQKNKKVLEFINNNKYIDWWKGARAKEQLWKQYEDSMGVGLGNLADETWDGIVKELLISAPLILLSGGAALAARLSLGARSVITSARLANFAVKARRIGRVGEWGKRLYGAADSLFLGSGASASASRRLLFKIPKWAKQIMLASVTLGAMKRFGEIDKNMAGKEDALKEFSNEITDPNVQESVKKLIGVGHLKIAAVMILGAIKNRTYKGDKNEFIGKFGKDLFDAYKSIGAIKISTG